MQPRSEAKLWGDREDPRRRLAERFGGEPPTSGQPPETALAWARSVLEEGDDVLRATARIRAAEPVLTLREATFLAEHAVGRR